MARTRTGRRVPSPATAAAYRAGQVIPRGDVVSGTRATRDDLRTRALGLVSKMGVDVFGEFVRLRHN